MSSEEVELQLAAEVAVCADALLRGSIEEAARSISRLLTLCEEQREHLEDSHIRAAAILLDGLLAVSRSNTEDAAAALRTLEARSETVVVH